MYKMYYVTYNHQTGYAKQSFIVQTVRLISDIFNISDIIFIIPRIAVALINHKKLSTAMNICFHSRHKKFLV